MLRLHHENDWDAVRREDGEWIEKLHLLLSHWDFAAGAPASSVANSEALRSSCEVKAELAPEPTQGKRARLHAMMSA